MVSRNANIETADDSRSITKLNNFQFSSVPLSQLPVGAHIALIMQPCSRVFPFFISIFKGQIVDRGQVKQQLNRKSLFNIFSVYQQATELVVMLIVFDGISSFLSIHMGVTYY